MTLSDLPVVDATLNAASAILLSFGYYFIRQKRIIAHRNCMITAFCTSTVFLVCYLIYHFNVGRTTFNKAHWFYWIYITILTTHTILAVVIVPMILITLSRALKARYELHKKIARWTWPLWMYVSVTGVLIYFLLYHIFPQRG
ncbi:MAG: DUF420 domain-containing protein [Verrucomicrobiota bacterium]